MILHLLVTLCILSSVRASSSASSDVDAFLGCLSAGIPPSLINTPATNSYSSLLLSSVRNLRYILPGITKPLVIVAATEPAHVQTTVICGRRHSVRIRTRSGGHDYEGLSYASIDPHHHFAVLDLAELRAIHIDASRAEAWVGSGATLGELYYAAAAANRTFGFPAGNCPTVGVGGHLSGGGFGALSRKYGLSADNVLDAVVVDAEGRLLNRSTMGKDLFWAIRGGGGESFGVVLSWKVRLVAVPETVTVFGIRRSRNESAVDLITKWQEISPALPRDLYLRVLVQNQTATFVALFLGRCSGLVDTMRGHFPDLGMAHQDCQEMSWVNSTVFFFFGTADVPIEALLNRRNPDYYLKVKSDHVQEPIPRHAWESIWANWLEKPEAALVMLDPYGGRMGSISPSATPFPHRNYLYQLQFFSVWFENGTAALEKRLSWVRGVYKDLTPYVSKNPRAVYVNYRDLDLGTNELEGNVTSYAKARVWGERYFKGNFKRLAAVKSMVDPDDFFRNEQSIPPLPAAKW
ncbi:Flavin-dependent oxidoreductase FOX1 [Dichanthelium oligosanthes]|uniref:Flavin-dependent oxidoreductase FOX1 n=1 Tax=Dichanthelium oligosanthes TaxID=888268 RepID=A0A1E5VHW3_9POAL|nr:Flavin-dependent oxidoreductase FOX1 [Dichanthelium oligosanthes]